MNRESRNAHFKRIILAVIIVFACLFQLSNFSVQKLFGIGILYTIPTVICISMFQGEIISMCCGLLAGIIWDSVSARGNCFHTVFLVVTAFIVSYAIQKRIRNIFLSAAILISLCVFLHNILYWLFFVVFEKIDGVATALIRFYMPSFLFTSLTGFIIYFIIKFVHKKFNEM